MSVIYNKREKNSPKTKEYIRKEERKIINTQKDQCVKKYKEKQQKRVLVIVCLCLYLLMLYVMYFCYSYVILAIPYSNGKSH